MHGTAVKNRQRLLKGAKFGNNFDTKNRFTFFHSNHKIPVGYATTGAPSLALFTEDNESHNRLF